jgi:putative MATE family efflux protein
LSDEQTQQTKFLRMTQTPVPKLVSTLAVPTIISMLITSFYNMADTFFVSKIGTSATGAVGVVFSLMAVIQAMGFLFGHGSGNYISRQLGQQQTEDAARMAATGFFSALIAGAIFSVTGLIFLKPLVRLLGATETILPYAMDYAGYILIGAPYMAASLVLNNQLRFQGSAFYSMIGLGTGAILNIALDPLFIFVLQMGVGGAALATIISQLVSFVLLLIGCTRGGNLTIKLRNFTPKLHYFKNILRGGLPSLCRQGLASVATICLNRAAGGYGDAAIAAMSVVSRITMFANSALIGFGQGFQPVCGFNYGAKLYARVREAFWFCVKLGTVFLLVMAALGLIFSPQLIGIFQKDDPAVMTIGTLALRLQCVTFPLNAWITMCSMMLQTIGKAAKASVLSMARQGLFFLPAILILPMCFGLLGVQISQPVADVASFILAIPLGMSILREMQRQERQLLAQDAVC